MINIQGCGCTKRWCENLVLKETKETNIIMKIQSNFTETIAKLSDIIEIFKIYI